MAVQIKTGESGNSVVIGNSEYPKGNYKLTYGEDDVTIAPLYPNLDFEKIHLKLDNILDDEENALADMDALKTYLSGVFYGEASGDLG